MITIIEFLEIIIASTVFFMVGFVHMMIFNVDFNTYKLFYTTVLFGFWLGMTICISNFIYGVNQQDYMRKTLL